TPGSQRQGIARPLRARPPSVAGPGGPEPDGTGGGSAREKKPLALWLYSPASGRRCNRARRQPARIGGAPIAARPRASLLGRATATGFRAPEPQRGEPTSRRRDPARSPATRGRIRGRI